MNQTKREQTDCMACLFSYSNLFNGIQLKMTDNIKGPTVQHATDLYKNKIA